MLWEILDTGKASAVENMRYDAALLHSLGQRENPILHFYDWDKESVTVGHFIDPNQFLNMQVFSVQGMDWAHRPTGGGIVFHLWDFAFSVLVPAECSLFSSNTLDNYATINHIVLNVVEEFLGTQEEMTLIPEDAELLNQSCASFCMARPTKYDVVMRGKKIAGAAQRRTKSGFLHQSTIALVLPDEHLLSQMLLPEANVGEAIKRHTFALLKERHLLKEARLAFKELLTKHIRHVD